MARSLMVTGGAGFIGVNFVYHWAEAHPDDTVVVLDALTYAGNRLSLEPLEQAGRIHFTEGDICDADLIPRVMADHDTDTVVHFAAESHVDRSITGPDAFIRTNLEGTHTLLAAARSAWLSGSGREHRFHHVSTDEVYGSLAPEDPAFTETTRYEPNSPYSASKAGSDHLVRAYQHTYGLQVTTSNCSNNYGPYHFPEKLIPLCLTRILDGGVIPVYGDGSNTVSNYHLLVEWQQMSYLDNDCNVQFCNNCTSCKDTQICDDVHYVFLIRRFIWWPVFKST